ncbi:arylsulfatase [Agromyces sp. H66]|uniref:arylsulfatase n=1 Tax=Agromyces sp. H66 TaxID=2529859 RepID=UPI0010AA3930|nr:arylsulfatase [Agromyces sp. H66]
MANDRRRDDVRREVLPIPDRPPVGLTTYDAKDPETEYPPIEPLRPPDGAPNVLIVLIDDVGFGASSAFGGPVNMPTAERLAANGLKYNRFHTTALCSPTRAALLTGRNHHTVGMGGVTEMATSAPGNTSIRPNTCAPLPETLKLNGYSTAHFGKCHEVPTWENGPMGPFDRWPTGGGFEHFYGFIGGETNQYYPALIDGTRPTEPARTPDEGYHLTEDLADQAIAWVRQQKTLMPDKPFFMYFAPGATHAPHHVPAEWSAKYRGRFDHGWDRLREETFARQRDLGVIPPDAELTQRHAEIPAWDEMSDELKPVLAREMEVYAGFLEHTDFQAGRLVDALADLEVLDDTLVYYIIGDNGASAEGTLHGSVNEMISLNGFGALETTEYLRDNMDKLGTPAAYNHYAVGWAHAMCTPYQWTKQVASHWGGTRNGTIVHWPKGIRGRGENRSQFCHVIDIAPTVLEVADLPEPTFVNGVQQKPYEGVSMRYSFDDEDAVEQHQTQYFEIIGNRGVYHRGWTAVTKHRTPWETGAIETVPFDDDVWELYAAEDWTQAHDLSAQMPDKLHALQRLWLIEAVKHNVVPLDDRLAERFNADIAGRPQLIHGNRQLFFGGMQGLNFGVVLPVYNKSHAITAEVIVPESGAKGVIFAQGGIPGGFSLYAKDGRLTYCYNFCGIEHHFVQGVQALPAGKHQVRMEFTYDGGGIAKGGNVSLFVDGDRVGEGRLERTEPFAFSADETVDVGMERGSPVSPHYGPKDNAFNGTINWVELDVDEAALAQDHLLTGAERFHVALALQ